MHVAVSRLNTISLLNDWCLGNPTSMPRLVPPLSAPSSSSLAVTELSVGHGWEAEQTAELLWLILLCRLQVVLLYRWWEGVWLKKRKKERKRQAQVFSAVVARGCRSPSLQNLGSVVKILWEVMWPWRWCSANEMSKMYKYLPSVCSVGSCSIVPYWQNVSQ